MIVRENTPKIARCTKRATFLALFCLKKQKTVPKWPVLVTFGVKMALFWHFWPKNPPGGGGPGGPRPGPLRNPPPPPGPGPGRGPGRGPGGPLAGVLGDPWDFRKNDKPHE